VFNIGPLELMVLAVVGLIVLGPDRLPGLARDAARLLRNLREMATGARAQLRDELGPEFADLNLHELRNLNPKTAIGRALLGDDVDLKSMNPQAIQRALMDDGTPNGAASGTANGATNLRPKPESAPLAPGEAAPFDGDAT
jgi:sec-independent protein translocase protein TatB